MKNTPKTFLAQVAEHIIKRNNLKRACIVFPNQRSIAFFREQLKQHASAPMIFPHITSISQFISDFTGLSEMSRIEALFLLFNTYKTLDDNPEHSFDKFVFWADMILSDFSEIDGQLANAQEVFSNVRGLKRIKGNYLDKEQKQIIAEYFTVPTRWFTEPESDSVFLNTDKLANEAIWGKLFELYEKFNEALPEGLSYVGRMERTAVEMLKNMGADELPFDYYYFVGFNALSKAQFSIFKNLKEKKVAEFFWDLASPTFNTDTHKGAKFIRKYLIDLPNAIDIEKIEHKPIVHIVGTPSKMGQAKYVKEALKELSDNKQIANVENAIDTAIVLPDESLFMPVTGIIDKRFTKVNIAMSYTMRHSSIANLMSTVAKMHRQARKYPDGDWGYFRDDVKDVVAHPIVREYAIAEAIALDKMLLETFQFFIPSKQITGKCELLNQLFTPISHTTELDSLVKYVTSIIDFSRKVIESREKSVQCEEQEIALEHAFLKVYADTLEDLVQTIKNYGIELNDNTFFFLIDRLMSSIKTPFEGEPLHGLQVLGLLETRCIDFKNLIILSVNEKVFPKKHYSKTFISQAIRKGHNLSTMEHQESLFAYYFYRMISRAENVYIIYDSRDASAGANEPSRYISQLKLLFSEHFRIDLRNVHYNLSPEQEFTIDVPKNERIMALLNEYRRPDSGKYLSASRINKYFGCPLRFYFNCVEGIDEIEEKEEYMSDAIIGTITHDAMEVILSKMPKSKNGKGEALIDQKYLEDVLNDGITIDKVTRQMVNKEYLKRDAECQDEVNGNVELVEIGIKFFIRKALEYDLEKLKAGLYGEHLVISETENKIIFPSDESNHEQLVIGNQKFNFTMLIDRVDRIVENGKEIVRIVDYKTGKDDTEFNFERMFDIGVKTENKAITQLFLYCNAYKQLHPETENIRPMIYKMLKINDSGAKIKKERSSNAMQVDSIFDEASRYPIDSDGSESLNDIFVKKMEKAIEDLFSKDVPFRQCDIKNADHQCKYCTFKSFCHRD